MKTNLPTTPGPWWFREEDGDEWELVLVVFYNDPFIEPTAKYVCSEFENDLKAMEGQWAKAHKPDEGVEAWAVFSPSGRFWVGSQSELDAIACAERTSGPDHIMWTELAKRGFTCEPVTIYRKEKE